MLVHTTVQYLSGSDMFIWKEIKFYHEFYKIKVNHNLALIFVPKRVEVVNKRYYTQRNILIYEAYLVLLG
jgi:hypothetical protein